MITLDRRAFLTSAAAAAMLPGHLRAGTPALELHAMKAAQQIAPEGYGPTDLWTFNGTLPGETLRLRQGDRLTRTLVNDLDQPTAIHWHGIRLDNAMDGVPYLTQAPVPPGGRFAYDFTLPDAGTYWYHTHANTVEQMARGLYGPLIVEEPDAPDIDAEHVLMLDDLRLDEAAQIAEPFDHPHDRSHAGRLGNVVVTNGAIDLSLPARHGERLRLRLINAANARLFNLGLTGASGWIVALDGMPLDTPEEIAAPFWLAPAQRADLIVDVTAAPGEEAHLVHFEQGEGFSQVAFPVTGTSATARRPAPAALPPNPIAALPDLAGVPTREMAMTGGAMRWLRQAVWQGTPTEGRDLAAAGQFWALNGQVGRSDRPFADLALGEPARIAFLNDTNFPHAMHLHGMHFREIRADGGLGPWRDTILTQPGERREIAFLADNPGDWLLHCHMLAHHAAGMGTWIRVAA